MQRGFPLGGGKMTTPTLVPAAEALTRPWSPTSTSSIYFQPAITRPRRRSPHSAMAGPVSRKIKTWLLAAFLLQAILAVGAWGQEFRGTIIGSVSDPTGAVIPTAIITAKGPQQTYTTRTYGTGNFAIPFVQ